MSSEDSTRLVAPRTRRVRGFETFKPWDIEGFAVMVALAVLVVWVSSLYQTPTYEASVKMLLSSQSGLEGPTVSWDGGDPLETMLPVDRAPQGITQTVFKRVVLAEPVARAVVEQLNLSEASLSARIPTRTGRS